MPSIYDIASCVKVWDFRASESWGTQEEIVKFLQCMGPRWAFQLEKGEGGYVHWQGRMSLFKKHRGCELAKLIQQYGAELPQYCQPACANSRLGQAFYVLKLDSRLEGPWTDRDNKVCYIQKRFRQVELRPFQQSIVNLMIPEDRFINCLICTTGNVGKSYLVGYAATKGLCIQIPLCNDFKECMGMVCDILSDGDIREPNCICLDLPRASSKERLQGLYSAIESIKDGYSYDSRYHMKTWRYESPAVWVFTNKEPDKTLLSMDRWKLWKVNAELQLVPY